MSNQMRFVESFQTTYWLIGRFAAGMTHEDSVTQPPFKANTFNWVLGHILVSRNRVLGLLNQAPVFEDPGSDSYESGSEPSSSENAVTLDRLLQVLDISQTAIVEGLESATTDLLGKIADEKRAQTVSDQIAGLHWHETYHVGQLEILRQVSGEREAFP
jgi:hypothetical protein